MAGPAPRDRHPPHRCHAAVLRGLLVPRHCRQPDKNDAHLAALAIEHGAELCSCDTDYSRFQDLRWIDPLQHD